MNFPEPYEEWERHEAEKEDALQRRPVCVKCRHHIQAEDFYELEDGPTCPECLEEYYKRSTEDYEE